MSEDPRSIKRVKSHTDTDTNSLYEAAARGDEFEVWRLLFDNPHVNIFRSRAMEAAVENSRVAIVKRLLLNDQHGLHYAQHMRTLRGGEFYTQTPEDDSRIVGMGITAAVKKGDVDILKVLVADSRAMVEIAAMDTAIAQNREDIVRVLLTCPRLIWPNHMLAYAAEQGRKEITALLLADKRVDPKNVGALNSTMFRTAKSGHLEIVKMLLDDPRVDSVAAGEQALTGALVGSKADIVAYLLLKGIDVETVFRNQVISNYMSPGVLRLLEGHAVSRTVRTKMLTSAAYFNDLDMVKQLLATNYVNATEAWRIVVKEGYLDIAQELLSSGWVMDYELKRTVSWQQTAPRNDLFSLHDLREPRQLVHQ
jgi:hypothetical protein